MLPYNRRSTKDGAPENLSTHVYSLLIMLTDISSPKKWFKDFQALQMLDDSISDVLSLQTESITSQSDANREKKSSSHASKWLRDSFSAGGVLNNHCRMNLFPGNNGSCPEKKR